MRDYTAFRGIIDAPAEHCECPTGADHAPTCARGLNMATRKHTGDEAGCHPLPIETRLFGFRFRSRLEARYALFFHNLDIVWQYEHEGYDIGRGCWYLPDFRLPELNLFVEIKGQRPTISEIKKCILFRNNISESIAIFYDVPGRNAGMLFANWPDGTHSNHGDVFWGHGIYSDSAGLNIYGKGLLTYPESDYYHYSDKIAHAVLSASQARF